jgi:hypothetical protein
MDLKHCPKCDQTKPVEAFYPHKKHGTTPYCRICTLAYNRERYRILHPSDGERKKSTGRPKGSKNKKPPKPIPDEQRCWACKEVLPIRDFSIRKDRNRPMTICKPCSAARGKKYAADHPEEHRAWLQQRAARVRAERYTWIAQFKQKPCTDCGLSYDQCVMEFDHVRGEKVKDVSKMSLYGNLDRLKAEIDKCDVVCANCHRLRTCRRAGRNHLYYDAFDQFVAEEVANP